MVWGRLVLTSVVAGFCGCGDPPATSASGGQNDGGSSSGTSGQLSTGGGASSSSTTSTATGTVGLDSTGTRGSTGTAAASSTGARDPFCGDSTIDPGEDCDDGNANADDAVCKLDCTVAFCGDGNTLAGVEECDDANEINNDGCTDKCILLKSCGDSKIQPPEQCDNGPENADGNACKSDCQVNVCGDGDILLGVESCDDNNDNNNDSCTVNCEPPACGDGFVQSVLAEICDDGDIVDGDECNGDCQTSGLWTETENGTSNNNDAAYGVAIDSLNNIVVVGELFDAVNGDDIWVRSYNGNGQINWTDTYHGGVTSDTAYGVAIAANDDVWVVGSSFSLTNGRDIWIRQYSPNGTPGPIFTANGDADGDDEAHGIAIDPSGDLVVVGYTNTLAGGRDIWVRKYTTAGAIVWTRIISSAGDFLDRGHGIATDLDGNIVVTGYIWAGTEARDIWVRKYDGGGAVQWTDTITGADGSQDEGRGIATDSSGNVIVTGFIDDGPNGRDVWIRKYDPDGVETWTETFNAPQNGTDVGRGVAVDTDDNILVGGSIFRGAQQDNVWLGKYDSGGTLLWVMEYNNSVAFLSDTAQAVAVDSEDNVAVVGFETRSDINEARNIWIRYLLQ